MKARFLMAVLAMTAASPPARADLMLKGTGSGSGPGMSAQGETVTYFKGGRMRSDWTRDGKTLTSILDLDHEKMISIDHEKKKAEVFDLARIASEMKAIPDGDMKVEIKPTGKTKSILGRSCAEYQVSVLVPYHDSSGMSVDTLLSGPAWIARDSPGLSNYRSFYLKAAEKGLFFNQPSAAKAQPGRAKGTTRLYQELAKAGVPYATDIRVEFKGTGMMAQMMSKMGDVKTSSTVTQVSTGPLADQIFEVPAGFKIKEK
jgi:uncharacterized cupredoxin-like copper-binding protein